MNSFCENKHQICLSSLTTILWLIALNHIGCRSKFLQTYQIMPRLCYILIIISYSTTNNNTFQFPVRLLQLKIFFSNKCREKNNTFKFSKLLYLCNRCNIMHQIACTFFKIFRGHNPGLPFGAGTQNLAPLQNSGCAPG